MTNPNTVSDCAMAPAVAAKVKPLPGSKLFRQISLPAPLVEELEALSHLNDRSIAKQVEHLVWIGMAVERALPGHQILQLKQGTSLADVLQQWRDSLDKAQDSDHVSRTWAAMESAFAAEFRRDSQGAMAKKMAVRPVASSATDKAAKNTARAKKSPASHVFKSKIGLATSTN